MHIPVLFSAAAYTAGYLFNQKRHSERGRKRNMVILQLMSIREPTAMKVKYSIRRLL